MNIEEIAKEYTREEFINKASERDSDLNCPFNYDLNSHCSKEHYSKQECIKCWKEAVKDIKFKDEQETFEAECIDDENITGITKGNKYPVIFENERYYMIIGDDKLEDNYIKSRFKLAEPPKEVKEINYEEEYNKLKKENERIMETTEEDRNTKNYRIAELTKENEELRGNNLKVRDELVGIKFRNEELKKTKEHYQAVIEEREKENEDLTKRIEDYQDSILEKQSKIEEMNTNLKEKDKQLEVLGNSVNKYYHNWLKIGEEMEKKDKNRILKDKVEALKESVISLTELL